jgi:hypothetical protein
MEYEEEDWGEEDYSEFDYLMTALTIYCMTDMTKEQYWNIINHVGDGFEFDAAVDVQARLIDIVRIFNSKILTPSQMKILIDHQRKFIDDTKG